MKEIPLSRGLSALVDDEDFESLNQHRWYADYSIRDHTFYARRNVPVLNSSIRQTHVFMHNVIMGAKGIDHRDNDGLNNQKQNLRYATTVENNYNRRKPKRKKKASSLYKGVSIKKGSTNWVTRVHGSGKVLFYGSFGSELEAAKAYDVEAQKHFGEFVQLNFPV